ncbi:MAG: hypothetical protein M1499_08240 [Firmicutes bacterium]|nr:hypothetical protein [Bacillota bacterium]
MKRFNGLVVGLGLLATGTIGGVAFAATHGATLSTSTPGSVPQSGSLRFTAMMGGPGAGASSGLGGMMASPMNQYLGNTHAAMGYVGSGGGGMMGAASGSVWTPAQVAKLVQQSEQGVTIDRTTNTITYHSIRGCSGRLTGSSTPRWWYRRGLRSRWIWSMPTRAICMGLR